MSTERMMEAAISDKSFNTSENKNIGVNYDTKNGVLLIDYETADSNKSYKMIVTAKFADDIKKYHVTENAYGISKNQLTDLLYKHAADRPPANTLAPDSKQYMIVYVYEKLPKCFYFMQELLKLIDDCHKNYDGEIYEKMSENLKKYLQMAKYKVYGRCYEYRSIRDFIHPNVDADQKDKYELNLRLSIIIDIISKFIAGESDATICGGLYMNKYHK